MYLDAAVMDMDEALRTLTLIGSKVGQFDTHMQVTGKKQGEGVTRGSLHRGKIDGFGLRRAGGAPNRNFERAALYPTFGRSTMILSTEWILFQTPASSRR